MPFVKMPHWGIVICKNALMTQCHSLWTKSFILPEIVAEQFFLFSHPRHRQTRQRATDIYYFKRLLSLFYQQPVWPDLAIYWTLGHFLKPLETISLPKSPPL